MKKQISRRDMLALLAVGTGAAAGGAVLLNGRGSQTEIASKPSNKGPLLNQGGGSSKAPLANSNGRLLVVLEMPGGNDGMSMVVPHGVGDYYDMRPSTSISPDQVLRLDDEVGLHPELTNLHRRGVTLVEGVGSFEPDGSHFEMMSQWWAGGKDGLNSETGWLGRLGDSLTGGNGDISALTVSYGNHPIVKSRTGSGLSIGGAESMEAVAGANSDNIEAMAFQQALRTMAAGGRNEGADGDLRTTLGSALEFADRLSESYSFGYEAIEAQREEFSYSDSWLSSSLMFASGVLASDIGVRVVHVEMDGTFDTHIEHNQEYPLDMIDLDTSLEAFHNELAAKGLDDRVMVMTTSEFGRTPGDNGSGGLDHGTASTMMLSGPGTGGRIGQLPSFTDLDENGDFKASIAFESYLAGVMQDWLGVPASEVFGSVEPLAIL